ncbi:MAG TPA: nucleotide disphospho-sugar-binding domain-containing protein [Pyrinomonadaceae bacterium]|nr:nucleotide disphospho-sugar-binding domain-containing protein [Pyrinomonadaceae bacterium]
MRRALFFPYPGGLGPVINCCAIADELAKRDWTVALVSSGTNRSLIQDNIPNAVIYETTGPSPRLGSGESSAPSFRTMRDFDDFAFHFQFDDPKWVATTLEDQLRAIRIFQPDILVGSWTFFTGVAGEISGVPVVQIFQAPMLSSMRGFRWWDREPLSSTSRCVSSINKVLRDYHITEISCVEDLTSKGDLFIIASLPEIDPIPADFPSAHHVGHLTWLNKTERELPEWLLKLESDRHLVYAYDGGLRYGTRILEELTNVFGETDSLVVFSVGPDAKSLPSCPSNFRVERFVPAYHTTKRSQLVVTHSGQGTDICCLLNGVPSIMIPTNSEREYYAQRVQALGAGKSINFDLLSRETFAKAYEAIAGDESFRTIARAAGTRAKALGGTERAAELIEQFVGC